MSLSSGKKVVKIVVAGDGAVGKTTLSQRLSGTLNLECDRRTTPGLDVHTIEVKGEDIFGQIMDLGGQDQFRFFQDRFFKARLSSCALWTPFLVSFSKALRSSGDKQT